MRRVTGEVAEQVAADVAGDDDEGAARNEAADAPEQIVGGDQGDEQREGLPNMGARACRQRVDQELDAVLLADRTADGAEHGEENGGVRYGSFDDVAPKESDRPQSIGGQFIHHPKSWAVVSGNCCDKSAFTTGARNTPLSPATLCRT